MTQQITELKISDDLILPIDACTQTFAFIARKGAGKTYAAGKLAELLLEQKVQVVILDTVGNWYGLRIAANGKGKGFDIPVFGGLRGDLPLQATAGHLVADVAVDTGRSLIVDISQFSMADRKRFATAFGEQLWKRKKGEQHPTPLMLIIEESQLIIPQFVGRDETHMVGIYEEIIRLGRNYGIGCCMISQRPQSVNKEVLNQTECLFVLQVNGAQERKSLKEWIVHQGMDVKLLDELPSLPRGTAYVWSPQWLGILKKVKIAKKTTFDASATPKVGDTTVRRDPAPLDLKEIETQMAATIEQAKANDPAELKRQLAAVKREISVYQLDIQKKKNSPVVYQKDIQKVPALTEAERKRLTKLGHTLDNLYGMVEGFHSEHSRLAAATEAMKPEMLFFRDLLAGKLTALPLRAGAQKLNEPPARVTRPQVPPLSPQHRAPEEIIANLNGESPTGGLRRMLVALAQRPGLSARQLGVRAGLSSTSGSFNTYLSKGRSFGWLKGDRNRMEITADGCAVLGDYVPLPEGQALLEYWLNELGQGGAGRILKALADIYPNLMTKQELGDATGLSDKSGSFNTYLSKLRTLELIEGSNPLKASSEFFQ
jgi:hypothetical protein